MSRHISHNCRKSLGKRAKTDKTPLENVMKRPKTPLKNVMKRAKSR